ncbi:hypothetical protein ACFFRR_000238 [Megaselia abdita]
MTCENDLNWDKKYTNIPKNLGKIPDVEKFDASFFGLTSKRVQNLHPHTRKLLEVAYEAVLDAGINTETLKGSRTGVYIGMCFSDDYDFLTKKNAVFGSRFMAANLISYYMDLKGPSVCFDTACSSSAYALDQAFTALKCGVIDSAIVGGCNLILQPNVSEDMGKLGALTKTISRVFDEEASGYIRSESVSCIFLQKAKDSKRIYGYLVHTKTNTGSNKILGVTYPSVEVQTDLLSSLYKDLDGQITVDDLGYFEAHGSSTKVGDPIEVEAIDRAITSKRKEPLLIGSIKSNMGHSEGSSALSGVIKALISLNNQKIPPNLNFRKPNPSLKAIVDGRLKVVVDTEPLQKPYIGVSSFGISGSNAHILLRGYEKTKNDLSPQTSLVIWSGRSEEAVNHFFHEIEKRPLDRGHVKLLHNIQEKNIPSFLYRGYTLHNDGKFLKRNIACFNREKRPLVWIFNGMGTQWLSMGKYLMEIEVIKATIQRLHNILLPKNIDLIYILSSYKKDIFQNNLYSFVGITSIQIALVNCLRALELEPDFIVGYSMGEMVCAYADGLITEEQCILISYYIGFITRRDNREKCSMVAVNMGYTDIKTLLPNNIFVACRNTSNSCTISGPCQEMKLFLETLKAKRIFSSEVSCGPVAYHTKHIEHNASEILKLLKPLIPDLKPRTSKWLSTCTNNITHFCPEYIIYNLFNPVLFEETIPKLPKDSTTLEIGPNAQLLGFTRTMVPDGVHLSLTKKDGGIGHLFSTFGEVFNNGFNFKVCKLFPEVELPVSQGTRGISSLIKWNHEDNWYI